MPSVPPPSFRIYRAGDAEPDALAGDRVVVLGYGHLGRSAALNLRDAGIPLTIGNRDDEYVAAARADGFAVTSIADAVAGGDVIFILLPDEVIPEIFRRDIAPALRPGNAIAFASGYAAAFELIEVPAGVDVLLVAPRMGGEMARERFTAARGFWAYVGVETDCSGRAHRRMLGLAAGIGALRSGAVEMSATMEATVDLFVEQTVGPLIGAALMTAFDVGVAAGIPPEVMVMEMYMSGEMETVFRGFREAGLFPSSEAHGASALFGGLTRSLEIDREALHDRFQAVLEDIRNGGFAKRFQQEAGQGYPMVEAARQMIAQPMPITEAERALRRRVEAGNPPSA